MCHNLARGRLTRRRLIAAGGSGAAPCSRRRGTATGQHAHAAGEVHAGHEGSGHADFRDGRTVDHAANGFDPHELVRDFDWGRTTPHGERPRGPRMGARRARPRDRGRARRALRRLDLQRPHPGPTLRCREGERLRITFANGSDAPAHDPLPRHPPVRDGRRARAGRGPDRAAAARPSTSSTPCPPGCTSTTATSGRSPSTSPRASTARSSSIPKAGARGGRRARDGHERVRHELRPRERALRRQHDPVRLHERADPGPARRADAASTSSTCSSTT